MKKSPYKTRRAERIHDHPMKARQVMPWYYELVMKDFGRRDKEQAEAARRGPLSSDPMVPWGNGRSRRSIADEEAATAVLHLPAAT